MTIEVKYTCPLGSTCEKIGDGSIERCSWFIKVEGKNPQSGEFMSERRCAMAWQPMLMIEGNGQVNGVAAAVNSLRNETIKRQDVALGLVGKNEKVITSI